MFASVVEAAMAGESPVDIMTDHAVDTITDTATTKATELIQNGLGSSLNDLVASKLDPDNKKEVLWDNMLAPVSVT
jgi:hypothetical protein